MARPARADAVPGREALHRQQRGATRGPDRTSDRTDTDRRPRGIDTDSPTSGPSLTVAAVARRLGVAPATLRTWDRRYGLGPSEHLAGSHRRYSSLDVARLLVMRRLTLEGVAPSEAARTALRSQDGAEPSPQGPSVTDVLEAYSDAVPMAPDPPALVAAAGQFDNAAVRWMLSRVHPRAPLPWWTELVQPALQTLTQRVALEAPGEHAAPALRAAAFAELRSRAAVSVARAAGGGAGPGEQPWVLALGAGAGSGGDLLVHVMATALQEEGVRTRVLSTATGRSAAEVVTRSRPQAVFVEVGADEESSGAALEAVQAVVDVDEELPVFVHRDGADRLDLPVAASVHRVRTLTGTLHEVVAVVG